MTKRENIQELVDLYLAGEITAAQRIELLQILDNPVYNDEIAAILQDNYSSIEIPELTDTATQHFITKLKYKIGAPVAEESLIPVKKLFNWKRIAVAASILVVAGVGVFYATLNNKKESSNPVVQLTPKNNLAPGKEGAILTLANGEQIVLDSAANGLLANQSSAAIIKKDGELIYTQSSTDEPVYNTMTTPRGRNYSLQLYDGTKVWLNAASSITFPTAFLGQKRNVEVTGEAYFEVAKDAAKPFFVKVKEVEVQVLGTHFNVMAYDEENKIATTLLEGSVNISKDGKQHLLQPGQMATFDKSGKFNLDTDVDVDAITAWKNGKFHFFNAGIKTIMRQISRWYDADVDYEDSVVDEKLTGIISRKEDVRVLLRTFEKAGGVKFKIEGKKIIVTK